VGENLNQKKPTIMEYLAFLSVKEGIYLSELHQALVTAKEKGKIDCQKLIVEYRGSVKDQAIFLITKDNRVVVQFRLAEELLLRKDICFENWMDTDKIRKQMNRQNTSSKMSIMVQDLRHGMKKVNIEAEVLETPMPSTVQTRYGNSAKVTNAWIADETGKIKLCLWNEQADFVTVGDTVQIKNASVSTFKGERQLRLGKIGTVSVLQNRIGRNKKDPEALEKNRIYA
jgi:replication factor A1